MDLRGKLIMECILETKAATILEFIQGQHGSLSLTFEEGTSVAWPDLRFPCRASAEWDAANHGATHLGMKDCHHHFNDVEERSGFRRPTIESASRSELSEEQAFRPR